MKNLFLRNALVYFRDGIRKSDVAVIDGKIAKVSASTDGFETIDLDGALLLPGFADVHVHFREPGFEYKETILTGSRAAAAGGYTDVYTMPNLNPVPDSLKNLQPQLDAIARDAVIDVHPFGSITKGQAGKELADLEEMAPFVSGYSDDGKGVQDIAIIKEAMILAKALNKPIVAHCEDNSELTLGGAVHAGKWAKENNLPTINSASEWKMVKRDIELVRETGCTYHICHVSTKESVELIRRAKAENLPITCETAPHYLILTDEDLMDEGRFKMNPPVRSWEDRDALVKGLLDGTIDCIATDHAPHSHDEKSKGVSKSAFGIVGLETAFPLLYTYLAKSGLIPIERIIDSLAYRPREIFGGKVCNFQDGDDASFTAFAIDGEWIIDPTTFKSKGQATPFNDWRVSAKNLLTVSHGKIVFNNTEDAHLEH